jgi:hypothetical protein
LHNDHQGMFLRHFLALNLNVMKHSSSALVQRVYRGYFYGRRIVREAEYSVFCSCSQPVQVIFLHISHFNLKMTILVRIGIYLSF